MLVPSGVPKSLPSPTRLAIFGSTGSIGCSTLELVEEHPSLFDVEILVAGTRGVELATQANRVRPRYIGIAQESARQELEDGLNYQAEIVCGSKEIAELAGQPNIDAVVAGIVGVAGLPSVLRAIETGKRVALANKESLVCGGPVVQSALAKNPDAEIIPVDSEHAALFQLLRADKIQNVSRLILTASGGPFLGRERSELEKITPEEAVRHPKWDMGAKISVDSATMMNKALEVIEAAWLFGFASQDIDVVVHPQSIVHSFIEFRDGVQLAHLSVPDMKGPIAYSLSYPDSRLERVTKSLELSGNLSFEPLDEKRFPAVRIARECLEAGAGATATFSLANELAVASFLDGKIPFLEIEAQIERSLDRFSGVSVDSFEALEDLQRQIDTHFGTC